MRRKTFDILLPVKYITKHAFNEIKLAAIWNSEYKDSSISSDKDLKNETETKNKAQTGIIGRHNSIAIFINLCHQISICTTESI